MLETVKLDFKISRKNVLLLSSVLQYGLSTDEGKEFAGGLQEESLEELQSFVAECLQKAGLTDLYEKLKVLEAKSNK